MSHIMASRGAQCLIAKYGMASRGAQCLIAQYGGWR